MTEEEKNIKPPVRIKPVFMVIAGAVVLSALVILFICRFGMPSREKTSEQWLEEGLNAFRKQDFFTAAHDFNEAARLDPTSGHAFYYLGQVYDSCGRRDEAKTCYTKALRCEPSLAAASFNLGLLYGLQRAPEMELAAQKQAISSDPAFAGAWFRMGELYYAQSEWADAAESYLSAGQNPNAVINRKLIEERLSEISNRLGTVKNMATEKEAPPEEAPSNDRLCTRCHTDLSHKLKKDNDNNCLRCHAPHNPLFAPKLKTPEKNQCQVCHFEYGPEAVKAARKEGALVHIPMVNGNCMDCHREHALGEKSGLRIDQRALCFTCHPDYNAELSRRVKHPPFANSYCTDCHNPHISKYPGLLWGPQRQMCYNCHFAFKNIGDLPVQHSPFKQGFCTSCHEPHASDHNGLLRINQMRLCYSCHFDRDADLAKPVRHKPYAEGRCCDCHDPHATQTKGLLPAPSQTEFCLRCHSRAYVFGPTHHPVPEGLACTKCHSPHAGFEKALLPKRSPDLCLDCHTFGNDKMALIYYKRSKHGKLSCFDCHGKEGFGFKFETLEEKLNVCLSCHPDFIGKVQLKKGKKYFVHPVGSPWTDINTGELLTCSSTCHNPHGTPYRKLLTGYGDGLCIKCHRDKKSQKK